MADVDRHHFRSVLFPGELPPHSDERDQLERRQQYQHWPAQQGDVERRTTSSAAPCLSQTRKGEAAQGAETAAPRISTSNRVDKHCVY